MNNEFENRRQKSYTRMRMTYDLTMGALILAMGFILVFGDRFDLVLISNLDPVIR